MTNCCIEDAVADGVKALLNSPIKDSQVHLVQRMGAEEVVPYCVLQVTTRPDKRTSEGMTKVHAVSLQAFFLNNKLADGVMFKSLVEAWVFGSNCIALGSCGCLCVQSIGESKIVPQNDGKIRYDITFSGAYSQSSSS